MAEPMGPLVFDFDPLTLGIQIILLIIAGYVALLIWRVITKQRILDDKRGLLKTMIQFNRLPTVPTIRIVPLGNGMAGLELGKRARVRDNSLKDTVDQKGWEICSGPVPILEGKSFEMGYITHPSGCTVSIKPNIKIIAADDFGNPKQIGKAIYDNEGNPTEKTYSETKYIEANFEGVIGVQSDLDDFNESTEREVSRGWIVPFLVGSIAGVVFFAPLFAWLMSWALGAGS